MPAVTWIDVQPESSARTSLKSFSDYLTETQDDAPVFTPSNRLCLSPETLNALDSAEKLVDDVERQLSRMNFDDSLTDDTEDDRVNGLRVNDELLHVQNLVKKVFQKGYYEPASRPVFNGDSLALKHTKYQLPKLKSSKMTSMPTINARMPVGDECLLCKSNESAKQIGFDRRKASADSHVEETKINEDKPEKLNVQKAPPISIKGRMAVQTARIVDIQPVQHVAPKRTENIATYDCRHLEQKDQRRVVSIIDADKLEQDALQINSKQQKSTNKSAFDSPPKPDATNQSIVDKENRFWDVSDEESQLDLHDFSLREPRILIEVDAVLQQQRNIIRQVHEATDKFDRFLAKRMPLESSSSSSLQKIEDSFGDRLSNTQNNPRQCRQPKTSTSEAVGELGKNNTMHVARREKSLSISRESLKPINSPSVSKRIVDDNKSAESKKRNSSDTLMSEASDRLFQDSDKQNKSQDTHYSQNFDSESSGDAKRSAKSESVKLESGIQMKNTDRETSSNNSSLLQLSLHTQTKSNAGFIENLKNSPSLKDNNVPVNLREKDNSNRNNVSTSIGNRRNSSEKKHEQMRTSETDDERELYNYQFDADLLEEAKEQAEATKEEDGVEFEKDKSTEKLKDNVDDNSQKTSHLIDSISDISLGGSSERTRTSQESQKVSFASSNELPKINENEAQESVKELSTESKIEMKLSEARDNLKSLMKTMDFSVNNEADDGPKNVDVVDQERHEVTQTVEQKSVNNDVPEIMKNITLRSNDARRQNCRIDHQIDNPPKDRSFMTMLLNNSEEVHISLEHQKLLLLKNLESCSIKSPNRGKRLFTSTIVGDSDPPANFTRSKESSTIRQDYSSDSNSEGEIRLSSAASHSLGEIRRGVLENKSSSSAKGSTTTSSANFNNSSSHSAGELNGLKDN